MEQERMETETMAKARQQASEYFRQGLNCAECVLRAFLNDHETDLPDGIIRLASGFGAGIGATRNMCGAISGAVLALGVVKGRDPFALDDPRARGLQLRSEVYPPFAAMVGEVEDRYSTLICKELTAPMGDFAGKERRKSCQDIVGYCAALAEKYAAE